STDRCRIYASSNTMDITLSEAPNLLLNRPVLTPALISAQAFFSFRDPSMRRRGRRAIAPQEAIAMPGYG
ncbi:hypothetical protein Q6295_32455, partial [Klebsiella pneumoniae]